MHPCWKDLPEELVERICNMLPKVRKINERLSEDIRYQWYKFDKYYFNCVLLFGTNNALYAMYDDMKNVVGAIDHYPEDMPYPEVILNMWKGLTPEERDEVMVTS